MPWGGVPRRDRIRVRQETDSRPGLRAASAERIDVDRLMIDLGEAILVGEKPPIEFGIGLVNLQATEAANAKNDFRRQTAKDEDSREQGQVLEETFQPARSRRSWLRSGVHLLKLAFVISG